MYQNAAIVAAVVLVYGAIAGRVARSWLSGRIAMETDLLAHAGAIIGLSVFGYAVARAVLGAIASTSIGPP